MGPDVGSASRGAVALAITRVRLSKIATYISGIESLKHMSQTLKLNDGHTMPQLGLGLMRFGSEAETAAVLCRAVEAGYRLFDTAAVYGTESQTGDGLRQAGCAREELFITTKLWNDSQGRDAPAPAFEASLSRLGLDYLDLYLIHWPLPKDDLYADTWRALIELRDGGKLRSIGVSNFTEDQLERIIGETGVAPAVNQVEMHPYFQQRSLRACHERHGIITQAWSPFGGGGSGEAALLDDPVIARIAAKHGCTPSQVTLRWHIACGASVIPKATSQVHLAQNMAAWGVDLDAEDIAAIAGLDREDGRFGPDPVTFDLKQL